MPKIIYVKKARERHDKDGNVKPLKVCDKCLKLIEIGQPYKHMSIKTGPRSSRELVRCDACPTWHIWEYSNSLSARIAQIDHIARTAIDEAGSKDDGESALTDAAEALRELAEEKRESASNIEEGFGHSVPASEELNEQAEQLESWAAEIDDHEVPEWPDPEEVECEECDGEGDDTCPECNGSGHPDDPTDDQLDEWRNEAASVLDNCPV